MTVREIATDGVRWTVWVAERYSAMYGGDEVPIVFESRDRDGRRLRRVARYSPAGGRRGVPSGTGSSASAQGTPGDTLLKRNLAAGGSDRALPALTALADLSDAELVALLRESQPAWTSPELGHAEG